MPATSSAHPIWIDLTVTDLEQAKRFYGELFDWTFDDRGESFGHYNIIQKNGLDVGGAMQRVPEMDDGSPDAFAVYLSTTDANATAEAAVAASGTVVVPPMQVGDQGTLLGVIDASGAFVGAWQPAARTGFQTEPGPGTPGWFELMTMDYDAALAFYGATFGLVPVPMEGMRYATDAPAANATYGICDAAPFLPAGTPSYWRVYIGVTDTDEAADRVVQLGGRVLDGPMDSPFGRLATVADDQGVMFQIIQPPVG